MARLLLHEWCASGGLSPGAGSPAADDSALAAEGLEMLSALVLDAAAAGIETVVLLDARLERLGVLRARGAAVGTIAVSPGDELARLAQEAARADRTIVVAPETDGLLAERVALVRRAGGRAVACAAGFIDLAADKQAAINALAGRGIPVPAGRVLGPGEPLPEGFRLPAVAKARSSCGGEGLAVLGRPDDLPRAAFDRRVESFADGTPVGVSCLCGPGVVLPLPPLRQRFATDGERRFLGGDFSLTRRASQRATGLARRAVEALAIRGGEPGGWVGVDMILGRREDGGDDRVLEVNPRLTTSFVGLRRWTDRNLLMALLAVADGDRPPDGWMPRPPDDVRGAFGIGAEGVVT